MAEVAIVPTGVANIASVMAAFRRLGASPRMAGSAHDIEAASHVMLPGVGAFGPAMAELRLHGFDGALRARVRSDKPTIAICVGHQLLFSASEESPGVEGLGLVEAEVGRFEGEVRVPQFGWNRVKAGEDAALLESGYAYFANSFRAAAAPGCEVAVAEHGGPFVAALQRGNLIGCQFHPELSGAYGTALLSRFLDLR